MQERTRNPSLLHREASIVCCFGFNSNVTMTEENTQIEQIGNTAYTLSKLFSFILVFDGNPIKLSFFIKCRKTAGLTQLSSVNKKIL